MWLAGASDEPLHGEPVGKALRIHGRLVKVTINNVIIMSALKAIITITIITIIANIIIVITANTLITRSRGSLCPATGETSLSNETQPENKEADEER